MARQGNNINPEYSNTRDAFITEEMEDYFKDLMRSPYERYTHYELLKENDKYYVISNEINTSNYIN